MASKPMENIDPRQTDKLQEGLMLTGGNFFGTTFQRCEIRGATLHHCYLLDSKLSNCKIIASSIGVPKPDGNSETAVYECSVRECEIRLCAINNVKISRSTILNPTSRLVKSTPKILQCYIQTSQVKLESIENCYALNCQVTTCKVRDSTLHECDIKETSSDGLQVNVTKSPLAFRKFPTEIRVMIFARALIWSDERARAPSLIAAPRTDPKMYHEALEVLYSTFAFTLSQRNWKTVPQISVTAFQSVRQLNLE